MVIRNRLLSLIYRTVVLGAAITSFIMLLVCYQTYGTWMLGRFDILITVYTMLIALFEVIANSIDLRKGVHGQPAGVNATLLLAAVIYEVSDIIIYAFSRNFGNMSYLIGGSEVMTVFVHCLLPALVLLDWVLFGEKGTVKWGHSFMIMFFPILYSGFMFIVETIGENNAPSLMYISAIVFQRGTSYPSWMQDANGMAGVAFVLAIDFAIFTALTYLCIFLNNLMAGKYIKFYRLR